MGGLVNLSKAVGSEAEPSSSPGHQRLPAADLRCWEGVPRTSQAEAGQREVRPSFAKQSFAECAVSTSFIKWRPLLTMARLEELSLAYRKLHVRSAIALHLALTAVESCFSQSS